MISFRVNISKCQIQHLKCQFCIGKWLQCLMSQSIQSFRRRVFPVNHWQHNEKTQETKCRKKIKKCSERCKHCTLAVVRQSQKILPRRRPPSRGCGTAKILSAGDGHYLHLQTQFGEDQCTPYRGNRPTNKQTNPQTNAHTDRTEYNTLHH